MDFFVLVLHCSCAKVVPILDLRSTYGACLNITFHFKMFEYRSNWLVLNRNSGHLLISTNIDVYISVLSTFQGKGRIKSTSRSRKV